jgi:hypothetical protein
VPIAFVFAYALTRSCMPFKGTLRLIALIPLLAPSLLPAIAFIQWFGNQGALKWVMGGVSVYGAPGIIMSEVFNCFPHALMILIAALALAGVAEHEQAVESGAGDLLLLQVAQQHRLVDHRAARDVDEVALGAECVEHLRVDELARLRAARRDDHQHVAVLRECHRVRVVRIRRILLVAVVVADLHAAGHCALRHRLADAAEAEDAHGLAAE